jgi:hypothetical protein
MDQTQVKEGAYLVDFLIRQLIHYMAFDKTHRNLGTTGPQCLQEQGMLSHESTKVLDRQVEHQPQ